MKKRIRTIQVSNEKDFNVNGSSDVNSHIINLINAVATECPDTFTRLIITINPTKNEGSCKIEGRKALVSLDIPSNDIGLDGDVCFQPNSN